MMKRNRDIIDVRNSGTEIRDRIGKSQEYKSESRRR